MVQRFRGLPKLAFGETRAVVQRDLNAYRDHLAEVVSGIRVLEEVGAHSFCLKSSSVRINGVDVIANVRSPIYGRAEASASPVAILVLEGSGYLVVEGRRHHFLPGSLVYLPEHEHTGVSETCSVVTYPVQRHRLLKTYEAIAGVPATPAQAGVLSRIHVGKNMAVSGLMPQVTGVMSVISGSLDAPLSLGVLGLDDVLYRLVALCLWPELLGVSADEGGALTLRERAMLAKLRDHIHANLGKPLQLTSLAILAGTSTRRVREMFLKGFGLAPADYIRDARLAHAKELLENAPEKRIREICFELGFTRASSFAALYRQRFGEPPLTTRIRAEGMRAGFEFYPPLKEQP